MLTLHGIRCSHVLLPQKFVRFEHDGTLVRDGVEEGKRAFVSYHHPGYARDRPFAELVVSEHITDHPFIAHDVWVVRERKRRRRFVPALQEGRSSEFRSDPL